MNAPPAQLVQIPFRTAALDEDVDPKQAPSGVLLSLRNAVWRKSGRIEKRPGTQALSTALVGGGNITSPLLKVWTRGREIIATDGAGLYSWLPAASAWRRVDSVGALEATWSTAFSATTSIDAVDVDATSSYVAMCWRGGVGGAGTYLQVTDAETGAYVVPPTRAVVSALEARVLIKGTVAILVFRSIANINVQLIDLTTGVVGPEQTIRADASNTAGMTFDVCHNDANWTLLYKTAGNVVSLYTYDAALVQQATAAVVTSADARELTLHVTAGEHLYVLYGEELATDRARLAVHNPATLAQTAAPTTVHTGAASTQNVTRVSVLRNDASSCIAAITERAADGTECEQTFTYRVTSTAAVDATSQRYTIWARIASKLFTLGGRVYMMLSSSRPAIAVAGGRFTQNTTFAVEVSVSDNDGTVNAPHRLAAVVAPREGAIPDEAATPTSAPVVGTKAYAAALFVTEPVGPSAASPSKNGFRLVTLSTELSDPWRSAQVEDDLVLANGPLSTYDGRRAFEASFLHTPRVMSSTPGTSGSMAAGTYLYSFVYEWRDARGMLHRSAPSQPVSVTVAGSGNVLFSLETATTTGKADLDTGFGLANGLHVRIIAYRSTVGGTTLYRLLDEAVNDPTTRSVAFNDTRADSNVGHGGALNVRPLLYTTGGRLDEVMPPSAITCVLHRGRVFAVAGDRRSIWFTKSYLENPSVFPGFHENLRITLEEDIVALASLDDKLVIFSECSIWVVFGDGPASNGQGSFEVPLVVQSDVGAISPRGVVETPDGVMFFSRRGLYLLTRSLEVKWIGREVRDQIELYPKALDARLVPHRNQVRFAMANDTETEGVVLVYDYVNRFWSVFDYHDGSAARGPVRSSVVRDDELHFTAGAALVTESPASCLDLGAEWVTLEFELMLRPVGPIAWQHVRRLQLLGERQTHHDLRLRLAFDDRASFSQDFTFTAEMVATNNDCPTVRIGSQNGANPKCKAIRVRVTDVTPTNPGAYPVTTGKGGWFSAIGLELIPRPGLPRHGARHSKV